MPTNTEGIVNVEMPFNGERRPFGTTYRYVAVPQSQWYQVTINSPIDQFISVQFTEDYATVFINNPVADPRVNIIPTGTVKEGENKGEGSYFVQLAGTPSQTITFDAQGNGQQTVWMNADSSGDSQDATITAQYL